MVRCSERDLGPAKPFRSVSMTFCSPALALPVPFCRFGGGQFKPVALPSDYSAGRSITYDQTTLDSVRIFYISIV